MAAVEKSANQVVGQTIQNGQDVDIWKKPICPSKRSKKPDVKKPNKRIALETDKEVKRMKNNEAARKCREKRRMKTLGYIKEAKEAVAFNSYIRKKLLNFYKASGKNIPPNSMLFNSSKACNFLDDFLEKSTEAKKMVVNDQMMEHHHIFAIGRETLRIQKMLHQHKLAKQVASLNASTPNSVSSPSSTNSSNSNSSNSPPQNNSDEISTPTSSTTSDRTDAGSNNSEESFGSDETRKDDKSPDPPPDIINIDCPSTSKKPALDKLAQFSLGTSVINLKNESLRSEIR